MSIAAYPAWPIRLEMEDGSEGVDLPSNAMEWQSSQSIRVAFEDIPLADYAADLLGTGRAPRGTAEESIRFIKVAENALELEQWLRAFRGFIARMRRGRLWIRDATDTRFWAIVRPKAMPEMTYGVEQLRIMPITLQLIRLTDWYAASPSSARFLILSSPQTFVVHSQGGKETNRLLVTLRTEPLQSAISYSGIILSDAIRSQALPAHFDGRQNDSSIGMWGESTNLITNGSLESNTNGWSAVGAAIARDTSTAVHGSASLRVTTQNINPGEGATTANIAASAGSLYTASCWVWGSGTIVLRLEWRDSSGTVIGNTTSSAITLSSAPNRITLTGQAPPGTTVARVQVLTATQQSATFFVDAVQLEQKPFATPYIHTNGSQASRSAPSLVVPADAANFLLSPDQGWIAFRIRPGVSYSQIPSGSKLTLFAWQNNAAGPGIMCSLWHGGIHTDAELSSTPGGAVSVSAPASAGQSFLLVASWKPDQLALSINGGPWMTAPRSGVPALSGTSLSLGNRWDNDPAHAFLGEILWIACGRGTLTTGDLAALAALGDNDPLPSNFPASSQLTGLWPCTYAGTASIVKPKITITTTALSIESQRTLANWKHRILIDSANFRVRFSSDNGTTWSDDFANVVLGGTQAELLVLAPGNNGIQMSWDASSQNPSLFVDWEWYEAYV